MKIIAPSLLSADFGQLAKEIAWLNQSAAKWLHVDIMDGVFVPNISIGFPILKAIQAHAQLPLDIHLMIINPDAYIEKFCEYGAHLLTVHYEGNVHLHRTVQSIKKCGAKAGVAINPHTPVELLWDILPEIDVICLMSVNPGFGGQNFIESTYSKLKRLKNHIEEEKLNTLIEVDGGVNSQNAPLLWQQGANILVAGNSVFGAKDPNWMIQELLNY